jgi:membrane-bound serine protease (ClpP class)
MRFRRASLRMTCRGKSPPGVFPRMKPCGVRFHGRCASGIAFLRSNRLFPNSLLAFVAGVAVCLAGHRAGAAEAVAVSVRLPITGTRDTQVERAILRQLERLRGGNERGTLVLSFDPAAADAADGTDFGRALELARFLGDGRLAGVKTVAFLPAGVAGHAVLVALACEEIVMAPDAVLGPANAEDPDVDDAMRAAYVQIAGRRRTVPPAVALALLDPAATLVRVSTDAGEQLVAAAAVAGLRREAAVLDVEPIEPLPLALTGRRARELGLVRLLAKSPVELARVLGVDERALVVDPALENGWKAAQIVLSGPISAERVARVQQHIDRAVAGGANFLCLRIDSAGGAAEQSLVLAGRLAGLDPTRVRTVAYVPRQARGDAALVALACDELVMHADAVLGGEGDGVIAGRQAQAVAAAWREGVARRRERSWSLPVALVAPGVAVDQATQEGTGRVDYFCPEELAERDDRESWKTGARVGVGPLALTGRSAEPLGLVAHVVDGFPGLVQAYGLSGEIALAEPGWADTLLDALASPGLAWLLLLIGGAGLYIELHTPGFGFGGFVSMVAFIIYFWSQHLHGTSGWLEVLLFLAGLFCLAAEIFVLPGFGVLGLGGGALVLASLVLASQSFVLPANDYQIRQLLWSLLGIVGAVVGVATMGVLLRRWLPAVPMLRNVLLEPPVAEADGDDDAGPTAALLGLEGTATTKLAPAGKARIDGRIVDVVGEGFIEPGTPVRVVAVRGGRVIVGATGSGGPA